jgi:hypothetical protein
MNAQHLPHRPRPTGPLARGLLTGIVALLPALTGLAAAPERAAAAPAVTVGVVPGGTHLQFDASSSVPATWELWVSTSTPVGSPPAFPSHPNNKYVKSTAAQATFAPLLTGLNPSVTYDYIVKATSGGGTTYKLGQARTKVRRLTVTFTDILVIDDSDDTFLDGAGDLTFHFSVNGNWRHPQLPSYGEVSKSGGDYIHLTRTRTVTGYQFRTVELLVFGRDDDCGFTFPARLCTGGTGPGDTGNPGGGSDGEGDWATATTGAVDIYRTGGPSQEAYSRQVGFETRSHQLKFRVWATIAVSYV